jgi:hypothetical protein
MVANKRKITPKRMYKSDKPTNLYETGISNPEFEV